MDMHEDVLARLVEAATRKGRPAEERLNDCLRLLAKYRSILIANTIVARDGTRVRDGPFKGMAYLDRAAEGCHAPKLLGVYESGLHPHLEWIAGQPYGAVIDVGCAEGYYAVGLALRLERARVYAYDTNPAAQAMCRELAALNGVAERVTVGGTLAGTDFEKFRGRATLVICDIEGGEKDLLDPERFPALKRMDVLAECHDSFVPGVSQLLRERFAPTHEIALVGHEPAKPLLPEWMGKLGHLDHLLAVWEWRVGPTPWLMMRARKRAGG
jgi:hypothetical protein